MLVFYWRRRIHETPRYSLAHGKQAEFESAAQSVFESGVESSRDSSREAKAEQRKPEASSEEVESFGQSFRLLASNPVWLKYLVGASLSWFVMDFAYYGNTVSSPAILNAISPHATLLRHTLTQLMIFAFAAAPGYFVAAWMMDRIGRKFIQALGFSIMAASFAAMALIPGIDSKVRTFLIFYAISYFFTEFGPNATTFIYPAELFPVKGRTTGHGIAAATGKLGAFVGVFLFPFFMRWHGLLAAELAAAAVSVIGLIITLTMLPETKGRSLEEVTGEKIQPKASEPSAIVRAPAA